MSFERIAKLMALTQSENEHEALSALRAVNRALRESNLQWKDVISAAPRSSSENENYKKRFQDLVIRYNTLVDRYNALIEETLVVRYRSRKSQLGFLLEVILNRK